MVIKILGGGCPKCVQLAKNAQEACSSLNISVDIIKVTDFNDIMEYNVMSTPALVVDEKLLHFGSVLTAAQITELLS